MNYLNYILISIVVSIIKLQIRVKKETYVFRNISHQTINLLNHQGHYQKS